MPAAIRLDVAIAVAVEPCKDDNDTPMVTVANMNSDLYPTFSFDAALSANDICTEQNRWVRPSSRLLSFAYPHPYSRGILKLDIEVL